MENRVHYGEYTLEYWIHMLLKRRITLPPYQRYYVWDERQFKCFITALKEKRFIPPVTIAARKTGNKIEDLIIDGQQRLTSVLLCYLGLFLDGKKLKEIDDRFIDDEDNERGDDNAKLVHEWNYQCLLDDAGKNSRESIRERKAKCGCRDLDLSVDANFFKNTYIGFSYLIPGSNTAQEKYFARTFKEINVGGTSLTEQESREALYYLKPEYKGFFAPDFAKAIRVDQKGAKRNGHVDFVRYLSIVAQYISAKETTDNLFKYGKREVADYYEEYICSVVDGEDNDLFGKFSEVLGVKAIEKRMGMLKKCIDCIVPMIDFKSIVVVDVVFFGAVYWLLYKGRKFDLSKRDLAIESLKKHSEVLLREAGRSPSVLKKVRDRLTSSIKLYGEFLA